MDAKKLNRTIEEIRYEVDKSIIQGEMNLYHNDEKEDTRATMNVSGLWGINPHLSFSFMNSFPLWAKNTFMEVIAEFEEVATFRYYVLNDEDPGAVIRVDHQTGGSYSYVGTDALLIPHDQHTMNFGWLENPAGHHAEESYAIDRENRRVMRHEVGHMFGLDHEHNHIRANQLYTLIYSVMSEELGLTLEQVASLYDPKPDHSRVMGYDPESIMHYPIRKNWNRQNVEIKMAYEFSRLDLITFQRILPAIFVGSHIQE